MSYLITGATGFLGHHILAALAQATSPQAQSNQAQAMGRHCILVRYAADWYDSPFAKVVPPVHVIEGNLNEAEAWQDDPRLQGIQGVFHLAAVVTHSRQRKAAQHAMSTNVLGTCNMVRVAAQHHCRLVFVSTSGTVGVFCNAAGSADEHAPLCGVKVAKWPYYASKVEAEKKAAELAIKLGVRMVIMRPPMMLGPGDHRWRSTGQLIRFLRGRLPFVVRGGVHYIDIRDAATALLAAMRHSTPQPIYNLPGTVCSVERFFKDIGTIAQRRPPLRLPYAIVWAAAAASAWLSRRLHRLPILPDPVVVEMAAHFWGVHSLYAKRDLNFTSRAGWETLQDTVAWIRAHRTDCGPPMPSLTEHSLANRSAHDFES